MISERAELEKTFSKMLKGWSKKWSDYVGKCKLNKGLCSSIDVTRMGFHLAPEFGSMSTAWKTIMSEADASAEVHQTVHDELQNEIIPAVKSWQKTKYVKSMMHIKPTKDFDEEFKRVSSLSRNHRRVVLALQAQKPWAKLYVKLDKYKREYHVATKNLKMAETLENNSKLDGAVPQDQVNVERWISLPIIEVLLFVDFSVSKSPRKWSDVERRRKQRKENMAKLFKNLIELIPNIWMT